MSKGPATVPVGAARVGKYLMLDQLGEGAFGKVRVAVDETDGRQYAIKIMEKSHIKANELTVQVRREIAVMKAMTHPNIVNLHEVLTSSRNLYMVMDLVTGGELFDAVAENGKLPEARARLYFQQLVDGIHYCHTRRVYHRDLKPENLLLSGDKQTLKITDFGLSSIKASDSSNELLHTIMGSPHYIAPEIITSAAAGYDGVKVDVWASGVILFGMLAGCLPFDEQATRDLYRSIIHAHVAYPPHFSYDVIKLMRAMLQKDPTKRPTMDEIKNFTWFKVDYRPAMAEDAEPVSAPASMRSKRASKSKGKKTGTERGQPRPRRRGTAPTSGRQLQQSQPPQQDVSPLPPLPPPPLQSGFVDADGGDDDTRASSVPAQAPPVVAMGTGVGDGHPTVNNYDSEAASSTATTKRSVLPVSQSGMSVTASEWGLHATSSDGSCANTASSVFGGGDAHVMSLSRDLSGRDVPSLSVDAIQSSVDSKLFTCVETMRAVRMPVSGFSRVDGGGAEERSASMRSTKGRVVSPSSTTVSVAPLTQAVESGDGVGGHSGAGVACGYAEIMSPMSTAASPEARGGVKVVVDGENGVKQSETGGSRLQLETSPMSQSPMTPTIGGEHDGGPSSGTGAIFKPVTFMFKPWAKNLLAEGVDNELSTIDAKRDGSTCAAIVPGVTVGGEKDVDLDADDMSLDVRNEEDGRDWCIDGGEVFADVEGDVGSMLWGNTWTPETTVSPGSSRRKEGAASSSTRLASIFGRLSADFVGKLGKSGDDGSSTGRGGAH